LKTIFIALLGFLFSAQSLFASQGGWSVVTNAAAGPIVATYFLASGRANISVFVSFEYQRKCDPIFSYMEFSVPPGASLGQATGRYRVNNPNLGVIHNGKFYSWHAAKITYNKGFEIGFGVTQDLWQALTGHTSSLAYVREDGTRISLPLQNLRQKLLQAANYCLARI